MSIANPHRHPGPGSGGAGTGDGGGHPDTVERGPGGGRAQHRDRAAPIMSIPGGTVPPGQGHDPNEPPKPVNPEPAHQQPKDPEKHHTPEPDPGIRSIRSSSRASSFPPSRG